MTGNIKKTYDFLDFLNVLVNVKKLNKNYEYFQFEYNQYCRDSLKRLQDLMQIIMESPYKDISFKETIFQYIKKFVSRTQFSTGARKKSKQQLETIRDISDILKVLKSYDPLDFTQIDDMLKKNTKNEFCRFGDTKQLMIKPSAFKEYVNKCYCEQYYFIYRLFVAIISKKTDIFKNDHCNKINDISKELIYSFSWMFKLLDDAIEIVNNPGLINGGQVCISGVQEFKPGPQEFKPGPQEFKPGPQEFINNKNFIINYGIDRTIYTFMKNHNIFLNLIKTEPLINKSKKFKFQLEKMVFQFNNIIYTSEVFNGTYGINDPLTSLTSCGTINK